MSFLGANVEGVWAGKLDYLKRALPCGFETGWGRNDLLHDPVIQFEWSSANSRVVVSSDALLVLNVAEVGGFAPFLE